MKIKSLHLKNLILAAIFALMSGSLWAYDFSAENGGKTIYYNITDDVNHYVEVTHKGSTDSYVGGIVVPQTVEHPDTHVVYTIKGVGAAAFKRNSESGSGGRVTSVSLPETVTYIGDEAFNNGHTFLTSVNIPDAVTSIGSKAFRCCRGLTGSLDLTHVTSIGTDAFYYCIGLTAVSVNADIPSAAFQNCSSLATLTLGNNVTSIGGSAFSSTALAGTLTIPNGVTSIGNSAFANLTGLTALTIGSGLATIDNYAFKGCTGLTSISFGTHNFTIGANAFMNCTGLTDLTLPANLTSVGQSAFQGCSGLENIYFYAANCSFSQFNVWSGCTHACTVTIGDGVAGLPNNAFNELTGLNAIVWGEHMTFTIGERAFYNCTGLTTLTIPNFVTSIGGSAFNGCTGITTLTIGTGVSNIGSYAFNGCSSLANIYFNATNCTVGGSGIFGNCTSDCTATIGNNVTNLPDYVFMSHKGLTTINWGTHTTLTIGKNSFSACSGLTSIAIPDCVTSIGEKAFMSCGNVTTLTIGASVTAVGNSAFDGCSKLETVYYNAINCTSIPDNGSSFYSMWNGCNKLSTIVIGNEVTHLPAKIFYGTKITTVNFDTDPHLQVIGYGAFYTCYSLTSFTIPNTVTTIRSDAFRSDNSLQTITIGSGVTTIGDCILYGCSGLETINWNVTNAENNLSLGSNCFTGIGNADQHDCALIVGDNVIALPNSIFSGCSGITSLTLGSRLQTIGDYAFSGCNHIGAITIPNDVTYLGKESFRNCSAATTLSIGAGVQDIKQGAFAYCSGLTSLTIPTTVTTIGNTESTAGAFQGCTGLTELIIPDNVTFVGRDAFNGCSSITTITIGDGVTYIGLTAFKGCTNLTELTIGEGVTTIKVNAFQDNGNLAAVYYNATSCSDLGTTDILWTNCNHDCTVHIGNNVTKLPQSIFRNFSHLTTVNFGSTTQLTTIGSHAFENCTGLTEIVVPSSVTAINSTAFQGCTGLTSLNLGTGVQTIDAYAFKGCTGLTTLMIPASVTSIEGVGWTGTGAFDGCTGLTEIWFMGTTQPSINEFAFDGVAVTIPLYYPKGYLSSYTYGRFANKIPFTLFTGASDSSWEESGNWAYGVPESTDAALVEAVVVIPDGCNAQARHIVFKDSNYIIIEDGGQLDCNSIATQDVGSITLRDGGQLVCNTEVQAILERNITGYGETSNPSGWYFITSPIALSSTEVGNLVSGSDISNYDLYYYDEASYRWMNYGSAPFGFTPEQGYLFAKANNITLYFQGTMPAANAQVTLENLGYASPYAPLKGFNLVGNPFTHNLTVGDITLGGTTVTAYYTVENGAEIVPVLLSSTPIKPGRGFMVQVDSEGQDLVFNPATSKGNTSKVGYISIAAGNDTFTDKAFIQMGGGNTLRKMTLADNMPKVYVQQGNYNYAVANVTASENVIPVGFEAAEDGTYTIAVDIKDIETNYLHLIDNMTGADIDLLALRQAQGPASYTFEAKTTDNASRFRLVFGANSAFENEAGDNEHFAFIDASGNIVINGFADACDASLQIVDMMGRIVWFGDAMNRVSTNGMTLGVYVLRLIQGNDVKTQKIVVE